jgi:hypothetical protein
VRNRRWVSVDEDLPRWCQQVIVAHVAYEWSNRTHKCRRRKKLGVKVATHWSDGRFTQGDHVVEEVVAWMPLPEPPKELP